ncbi:MAG: transposase [Methylococcales bacterium]
MKVAGLDPKSFDSGQSIHKKTRLSKAGHRYLRSALHMPASSAKTHDPQVCACFQHLIANGRKPRRSVRSCANCFLRSTRC